MAGLVPRPYIFDLQSAIFPRGRYEDAAASSTEPRVLHVLAVQATYDLQSVYFFCLSDLRSAYQAVFGLYLLLFYKVGCV